MCKWAGWIKSKNFLGEWEKSKERNLFGFRIGILCKCNVFIFIDVFESIHTSTRMHVGNIKIERYASHFVCNTYVRFESFSFSNTRRLIVCTWSHLSTLHVSVIVLKIISSGLLISTKHVKVNLKFFHVYIVLVHKLYLPM